MAIFKLTTNHNGKMEGMISLSTAVSCNKNCKERAKIKDSICSKCYAEKMSRMYKSLDEMLKQNTQALTTSIIPDDELPRVNALYFRFEAFGDLNNDIQVINYFNICKKNPGVHFALWTKNPWFIYEAIKAGNKKPKNLVIILSSPFINKVVEISDKYDFVDKVFTVYDKETSKTVNINCGSRKCLECGRCYKKTKQVEYINEILK